jgi:hypothetical protein
MRDRRDELHQQGATFLGRLLNGGLNEPLIYFFADDFCFVSELIPAIP